MIHDIIIVVVILGVLITAVLIDKYNMENQEIKVGDTLISKSTRSTNAKVLAVCGKIVAISSSYTKGSTSSQENSENLSGWHTIKRVIQNWDVEYSLAPTVGKTYFTCHVASQEIKEIKWTGSDYQNNLLKRGLVFESQDKAQKKLEDINKYLTQ